MVHVSSDERDPLEEREDRNGAELARMREDRFPEDSHEQPGATDQQRIEGRGKVPACQSWKWPKFIRVRCARRSRNVSGTTFETTASRS